MKPAPGLNIYIFFKYLTVQLSTSIWLSLKYWRILDCFGGDLHSTSNLSFCTELFGIFCN